MHAVMHRSSVRRSPHRVHTRDVVDASCACAARAPVRPTPVALTGRSVTTMDRRRGTRTAWRDDRTPVAPFGGRVQTP